MADVSAKTQSTRVAIASGVLRMQFGTLERIRTKQIVKGDVLTVADVGDAKRTPYIIPVCHSIVLSGVESALRDAGLDRVTVSLDGLSDATFKKMSDSNVPVATILDGIAKAQAVGFEPVKVNMVVKRGANEHEIVPMAEHFRNSGVVLRFIEYMDVGCSIGLRMGAERSM